VNELEDVEQFIKFIKTAKGLNIMKSKLAKIDKKAISIVFTKLVQCLPILMIDPYANFFCKDFFTFCCSLQRNNILLSVKK
jgi:hypothetical protein